MTAPVAPREPLMAAAQQSLQALYPDRIVLRGLQDPAVLGDARLRRGVYALVAEESGDWTEYLGGEARNGTLSFAVIGWLRLPDAANTEALELAEATMEGELLAWCQAQKPAPLDAIYPKRATYSGGLEHPVGWIVMRLEALYV